MKNLLIICSILFSFVVNAQQGYPVPPKSENRLFYIQHNDNKNTFVYDALFSSKGILDDDNPVDIYRILYAEDGSKKPLTSIQKKLAYGLDIKKIEKNVFQLTLVSYPTQKLTLKLDSQKNPIVQTTVNNKLIILNRVFLKQKKGTAGISVKLDYILFYGKDKNGKSVEEKIVL
ncbi:DUF4833 domain-containing protein [Empedobacter falsenii]|uniref:DUF4833 domain-containing protein n=1 Tax=Empedobacter falsenii TaxID=343874 RepID=UPI00068A9FF7|nr:DUF4833 domain-containing protein [Empedobacter falsenii]HAD79149.1 DUF4833 domain-containing protein [Flavobacteriaceae bacterium]